MHPVDGEVPMTLLGSPDEIPAELRPGRLRGHRLGLVDVQIADDSPGQPASLQKHEQTPLPRNIVVSEVQLGHSR